MRGLSRKWVWRWAEDNTPAASRSDLPRWRLAARAMRPPAPWLRSEEHTSELQSLMRISYAVFCLKKKKSHDSRIDTYSVRQGILIHANHQTHEPAPVISDYLHAETNIIV